ncbi:hypothetical protein CRUP_010483 [Coryphaenoides rupestris]|nr:hypothetical protein CRUP_010483 [Coryphaenoides rupestris]
MKKFNIRKVLDGLTAASSSSSSAAAGAPAAGSRGESDGVQESLQSEHFQLCKTVRHGFPHQPSSMTFDPVQKILAVGTQGGALRLFGRSGVECYCQHESGAAVIQLQFLINEGALVSALADDSIHLWNLRQKLPAILHSLKFSRERITYCHLPFQSKWLYIGTERGNIHIVNVESFTLSGYVIMWNKAIELSTKTHPGPLLIGFECGIVVLWDLKCKKADYRYSYDEAIHSVAWHHEGKQFVCSHSDGTLTTWNVRLPAKPVQTITPHGKQPKDGKKPEPCKPILKVEYKTPRAGEPFMILSGGLSYDTVGPAGLPHRHARQEHHGAGDGLPHRGLPDAVRDPSPYPLSIHESPVTCCEYFADCPAELIAALYSTRRRNVPSAVQAEDCQSKQPKDGKKPEPCKPILKVEYKTPRAGEPFMILSGGLSYDTVGRRACLTVMHGKSTTEPYAVVVLLEKDLVVIDLGQIGYPIFESPYPLSIHESPVTCCEYFADCPAELIAALYSEDKPSAETGGGGSFAIQTVSWCPESRVSASRKSPPKKCRVRSSPLKQSLGYQVDLVVQLVWVSGEPPQQITSLALNSAYGLVRSSPLKQSLGYQVDLVVQLVWVSGEPPQQITSLALNSAYGLVVFGNSNGLAVVDYLQRSLLLNMGTSELYTASDPYQRQPRSPRKTRQPSGVLYKLKTAKVFERARGKEDKPSAELAEEDPFAIQTVSWCPESRVLCVAGVSAHVIVYRFSKQEVTTEEQSLGYQVDLVVQLVNGLAVVDYLQRSLLLNMGTSELYTASDPYQRQPRSPRKTRQPSGAKMSRKINSPTEPKPDSDARDSSFSRSRSSSVTSIERESREAISSFHFCESFPRKASEGGPGPCLMVGTTQGALLLLELSLPPAADQRLTEPVGVSSCGTLVRLKGGIMTMALLDSAGALLPPAYEPWYDPNASDEDKEKERSRRRRPTSPPAASSQEGGGGGGGVAEGQYAVVCSEKQAKVLAMPSQAVAFKHNITESSFVLRADVVQMANTYCIACFCANGHIMTLRSQISLFSLRRGLPAPCWTLNYLPLTDMRIARTFTFSNLGQALYLTSPTEVQRITYSQETCDNLQEMLCELFTPVETPEAPNRGFFKGLFGGGAQSLDREDLFGETAAGKASRSLAQHIPGPGGMEGMKGAASGVALDERGQKLGELDERTAAMMASADSFSKHAHDMMLKYKDKKWYQL